jgi:iron complex outermembrane receptor protein
MNKISLARSICCSMIAIAAADPALAQQAPPAEASTGRGWAESEVQDIIVTAQKRSESISRVGLAITALSGDALQKQQIRSVADLAQVVPGLSFSASRANTPVYTLRGVGFNESSLGAYSPVAVYMDEVPLPFPVLTTEAGLDLERVEVLKGPQGILFGQNATGGAINYIAAKPTDTFKGGLDLTYGRFNDFQLRGFVSGPISDTLKARFSYAVQHTDDWQYSYTREDTAGEVMRYAGRLLIDWAPSDRLSVMINLNGWKNRSDPQMAQAINVIPQVPFPVVPALNNYPLAPRNNRAADWSSDIDPTGNESMVQASVRFNYELTDAITLTSISSYIRYDRNSSEDTDGINLHDSDLLVDAGKIENFDQEIRLSGTSDGNLKWMVGGNYEHSKVNQSDVFLTDDSPVSQLLGFRSNGFFSNQRMNNYAAFANVDFDVIPELTLKLGGRYTKADRHNVACTTDPGNSGIGALFTFLAQSASGDPTIPLLGPGDCITLDEVTFRPTTYRKSLKEDNVSWRVGVDYKPTSSLLFYANVAKGYKAGSFGAISASTTAQFAPVVQESVLDFEGGFKVKLFDRSLLLEGAVFHYDYRDKQIRGLIVVPIFGTLDNLRNVPRSTVDGAELSLSWTPVEGLSLSGAGTYLNARIKQFVGPDITGVDRDFGGSRIPFTPKWQLSGTVDYSWEVSNGLKADFGATISYKSRATGAIGAGPISDIDPYALLDLRAGIGRTDGAWRLSIFGKNVTDKYYWTNTLHAYDTDIRYAGRPATYGATLSIRY